MDTPTRPLRELLSDAPDRRKARRFPGSLPATLILDGREQVAKITSLSRGGVSVRCRGPVSAGQTVSLLPHQQRPGVTHEALQFQVQSTGKPSADMLVRLALTGELADGSWLAAELREAEARAQELRQRRGGVRVPCELPATLAWDGHDHAVTVRDLGTTGARVALSEGTLPDRALRLSLTGDGPSLVAQARLASVHDARAGEYGLVFTGFEQGGPKEVLETMRRHFNPRRS